MIEHRKMGEGRAYGRLLGATGVLAVLFLLFCSVSPAGAADTLQSFLEKTSAAELVPGADGFGAIEGSPSFARVLDNGESAGFVFLNTNYVGTIGYSGKPIHVLIGMDREGTITGVKLVKHSEPIVLIGIPEKRVIEFMDGYVGLNVRDLASEESGSRPVDIISGATVTVMVIEDSIVRSSIKFARALGLAGLGGATSATAATRSLDTSVQGTEDWETLLGDGSVRHRRLTIGEVNEAFAELNDPRATARPERGEPDETFIDLYLAPVSVPPIGRSLLGENEYNLLTKRLEPGQHAVLVFANGVYSFKGSGYVRGGIFDRIHLVQGTEAARFRDRDHKRLRDVRAAGAPDFKEVGLFVLPESMAFEVTEPFRLELLVQRAVGAVEKVFLTFDLEYGLPDKYVRVETPPAATAAPAPQPAAGQTIAPEDEGPKLWQRIWSGRVVDIVILSIALILLTILFFFQDILVKYPKLTDRVRLGFLTFTLLWIGFYAQAQLSVVNVLTFFNALVTDFSWDYFLMEPMVFILWCAVAASLIFWGRGAYCGWLCPFGALQELLNRFAKWVRIPQIRVPWGLHERLWPIKYLVFLALFGLSFYSLGDAEHLAEIEPFKTSIILKFVRDWPFVLYAGVLLVIGLFIERFFCRYLCPLGAALAIPGRMRTFDWLKRHKECGTTCQICAQECMVQAIHPEGHINPNECLYCLNCQTYYWDDHRCPPMIQRRQRRERRMALSTKTRDGGDQPAPTPETPAPKTGGPAR